MSTILEVIGRTVPPPTAPFPGACLPFPGGAHPPGIQPPPQPVVLLERRVREGRMKRFMVPAVIAGALALLLLQATTASSRDSNVLEFGRMAPVTGPYVGSANPIRGINGGGLPWQIQAAHGELSGSGKLEVEVR